MPMLLFFCPVKKNNNIGANLIRMFNKLNEIKINFKN